MTTQCEKLLDVLSDGEWHSTKELIERTRITYPPRRVYDLKKKGFTILTDSMKDGEAWWAAYKLLPQQMTLL